MHFKDSFSGVEKIYARLKKIRKFFCDWCSMKHDYVGSREVWVKIPQHRPNFKNVYAGIVRQASEMKARWCK